MIINKINGSILANVEHLKLCACDLSKRYKYSSVGLLNTTLS